MYKETVKSSTTRK